MAAPRRPSAGPGRPGSRRAYVALVVDRCAFFAVGRPRGDGDDASARREQASTLGMGAAGTAAQRARTASGAPLAITASAPSRVRTSTDASGARDRRAATPRRSYAATSAGARAVGRPRRALHQRDVERVASHRRHGRSPASLHRSPSSRGSFAGAPDRPSAPVELIAPSVRVPVLSVKRTSMFPRSSIVTSRFTSTRFRAAAARAGGEAHRDDRRQELRRDPDRDGQREQQRLDSGRKKATLITKIEIAQDPGDLGQQAGEVASPSWKAVSGWRSARPAAIFRTPCRPGGTTTPRPALMDDGAHEGARRQVEGRSPVRTGGGLLDAARTRR